MNNVKDENWRMEMDRRGNGGLGHKLLDGFFR